MRAVAVHAHVRAGGEDTGLQPVAERRERAGLVRHVGGGERAGLGEADDVGDVLRAGAAAAFLVSAEHEGLDLRAAAQVEDADALGGVELVARDREHVHGDLPDVDRDLTRHLHGVRVHRGAELLGDFRDLPDGEDDARLIVRPHDGDEGILRARERGAQRAEVDLADGVDGEFDLFVSEGPEASRGLEDGGVLDGGGDDFHRRAVPVGGAPDRGVVALRGAGGEVDLVRLAVQERGDLLARPLYVARDLSAEEVHGGRVAVEVAEEGLHRVAHLGRDLGGGVVVEVDCLARRVHVVKSSGG